MTSLPVEQTQSPNLLNPSSSSSSLSTQPSPLNASNVKNKSSRPRPVLLPDMCPPPQELPQVEESSSLEGVTTNVKLILKLLQEHKDTTKEDDGRKPHRLAGILRILDDVRSRIELCSQRTSRHGAELRRCNTSLHRGPFPTSPTSNCRPVCTCVHSPRSVQSRKNLLVEPLSPAEENQRLRRELSASMTARKSLERMFSSEGREKEMIARELARKVQEFRCMEELVVELKAEIKMLNQIVMRCSAEHRDYTSGGGAGKEEVKALQERNKELSEQLMRSLEGYKATKRKLKEAQDEMVKIQSAAGAAAERLRRAREKEVQVTAGEETAEIDKVWEKLAE